MGEKKVLGLVMFVMAYTLAMITHTASDIPATCNGDEPVLTFCGPYLVNKVPNPSSDCCKGATKVFNRAMGDNTGQGIRDLCNCLRGAGPSLGFQQPNLINLPSLCGIKTTFSMPLCILGPNVLLSNQEKNY
ncbi:non-specific lipid-transfer protein [Cajanus cajan]|uniref:Bifunctional inhibitor/plant lipid transfer protein/seed storage helical domain-containing protein n=1 Tax=Cajanus cajan TaxID=3821 RepID=A0A151QVQ1_CAJCA|nr:non-specific lipid-transfer protein [Cajanus cajan]KYP34411.1 hypothetical protein KK1_044631 [Cajanus cajan]